MFFIGEGVQQQEQHTQEEDAGTPGVSRQRGEGEGAATRLSGSASSPSGEEPAAAAAAAVAAAAAAAAEAEAEAGGGGGAIGEGVQQQEQHTQEEDAGTPGVSRQRGEGQAAAARLSGSASSPSGEEPAAAAAAAAVAAAAAAAEAEAEQAAAARLSGSASSPSGEEPAAAEAGGGGGARKSPSWSTKALMRVMTGPAMILLGSPRKPAATKAAQAKTKADGAQCIDPMAALYSSEPLAPRWWDKMSEMAFLATTSSAWSAGGVAQCTETPDTRGEGLALQPPCIGVDLLLQFYEESVVLDIRPRASFELMHLNKAINVTPKDVCELISLLKEGQMTLPDPKGVHIQMQKFGGSSRPLISKMTRAASGASSFEAFQAAAAEAGTAAATVSATAAAAAAEAQHAAAQGRGGQGPPSAPLQLQRLNMQQHKEGEARAPLLLH
ncbi:LOW QUALITY PROTEIN: TBC domain-containing kinase (incomplete catalytic triad), putative [Eimeria mitis]|uniref:TBC domain-containing kinase (Incomplete catalytic triad), putative n=1 Tax=Eimeria mitis TaxID=44415 RepID=U6K9J3_9EIME|nr:LOW QUALITY PROTEIN: TBC domain-containing kinase (incomplete catalytic triad), putative [Eimeria mitis]CDJ33476.1 TBC domain-containing kinase (incomplete catalytic triad), putative [Eimeria mitis]